MRQKTRWFALVAVAILLITTWANAALAAKPTNPGNGGGGGGGDETSTLVYTALGDSIAVGMNATGDYGYVYIFRDHLATTPNTTVDLKNKAMRGIKSGDLLTQLKIDRGARTAVKNANVLTISIGGNNLLGCASNNYETIDTVCAQQGVDAFREDWPRILYEIRSKIKSGATIYVLTLYNPYPSSHTLRGTADTYVQAINTIITDSSHINTYNYQVADAYGPFVGNECAYTFFCEATRDPHPNDAGHHALSDLHEALHPITQ